MTQRNNTDKFGSRLGVLRTELETLESDMKKVSGDVEGIADNRVQLALHKAEDIAHSAYQLAEDAASHAILGVDKWATGNMDAARNSIRTRPLSALVLSLGIGAMVGLLFGRR